MVRILPSRGRAGKYSLAACGWQSSCRFPDIERPAKPVSPLEPPGPDRGLPGDRRCIFSFEVLGPVFCPDPDPGDALSDANVPHGFTVPGELAVKVRRPLAGHGGDQRTISRGGATVSCCFSPDSSGLSSILIVPSGRIRTAPAPVCCAARIARATSAWVTRAGVRRGTNLIGATTRDGYR